MKGLLNSTKGSPWDPHFKTLWENPDAVTRMLTSVSPALLET